MEFFVGIQNTPYYHWQINLLLESFAQHGMQEQVLVANAINQSKVLQTDFDRNLKNHKRIYKIAQLKSDAIYPKFTILTALYNAVRFNMVTQPFALIEPSTVLYKSDEFNNFVAPYPRIDFAEDFFFSLEECSARIPEWHTYKNRSLEEYQGFFPSIGSVMIFNRIPAQVFYRTINICQSLVKIQLKHNLPVWYHTDKLAWAINLYEFADQIKISNTKNLAANILTQDKGIFLDYEHGIAPQFSKNMFKFEPPLYASIGGDPYETLDANNGTPNALYLAQLARIHLNWRKKNQS